MQEVAAGAKGTDSEGPEGATGDVPAAAKGRALLCGIVDKQAAAAVVAVTRHVEATAQLSLVLWVAEGNVKLL